MDGISFSLEDLQAMNLILKVVDFDTTNNVRGVFFYLELHMDAYLNSDGLARSFLEKYSS